MGKEAIEGIVTVVTAIIGVAIIATLVSKNANTASVLGAGGAALGGAIQAAEGPVTISSGGNGLLGQSGAGNLLSTYSWSGSNPVDSISI